MQERSIDDLIELINKLRGEGGCPWDQQLTLDEIICSIAEESYELQWANAALTDADVFDELGDILFLTCFATVLFKERYPKGSIGAIAAHAYQKIRRRHPHVFDGENASTKDESIAHWNRIKREEKQQIDFEKTALGDIRENLPPLKRSERIQRAAAAVGFDWTNAHGIIEKLHEEVNEAGRCLSNGSREDILDEVGDLLFSVVNLGRFLNIDLENALSHANAKFVKRFKKMEALIVKDAKRLEDLTLEEMDVYWEKVKEAE